MKSGILINSYKLPLERALQEAIAVGVDGIQLYVKDPFYDLFSWSNRELENLRQKTETAGVELSALCAELGGHGFQREVDNPAKIAMTKKVFELAKRLNVPIITMHIGVIPENKADPVYEIMLRAMTELGREGQKHNLFIGIETGPETSETLRTFIEKTDGGIGVNLDPANLVMVQNCDPVHAVRILNRHIIYTHFKDGVHYIDCDPARVYDAFARGGFEQLQAETGELFRETAPGKGKVNFPAYLKTLEQNEYKGYLTIEREATEKEAITEVNEAFYYLKQQLKGLES